MCEKNSPVNLRFEIFVIAFRVRNLFGTLEKRAPRLHSKAQEIEPHFVTQGQSLGGK